MNYKDKALAYAEQYGIIEYTVKKNLMSWKVSYDAYLSEPRCTIKYTLNLDTMQTTSEKVRFDSKGYVNR